MNEEMDFEIPEVFKSWFIKSPIIKAIKLDKNNQADIVKFLTMLAGKGVLIALSLELGSNDIYTIKFRSKDDSTELVLAQDSLLVVDSMNKIYVSTEAEISKNYNDQLTTGIFLNHGAVFAH